MSKKDLTNIRHILLRISAQIWPQVDSEFSADAGVVIVVDCANKSIMCENSVEVDVDSAGQIAAGENDVFCNSCRLHQRQLCKL